MVERDLRKVEMAVRFRLAPRSNKKSKKCKVQSKKLKVRKRISLF